MFVDGKSFLADSLARVETRRFELDNILVGNGSESERGEVVPVDFG